MTVLMTLRVAGDAKSIEAMDPAALEKISARAREMGALAHHFYGNGSEILVVDVWRDAESFQAFFDGSPEIPGIMADAGVTTEPTIEFWQPLDVTDGFG